MLTERKKRFAFEFVKDWIGYKAAIRAGYSEAGASDTASRLLDDPEVLAMIEDYKETNAAVARLDKNFVLRIWMDIASADPRDLVSIRTGRCRYCWPGLKTAGELPPNPECKKCEGAGERSEVCVTDTSKLKGPAKALYAGAVQTKDGIKVLMRDQNEAVSNLAKYLGMINGVQLSGPGGGPIPVLSANYEDLSDAQLAAIAAAGSITDGNTGVQSGVSQEREPLTLEGSVT